MTEKTKSILLIISLVLLIQLSGYANMAKPWSDGATHTSLYGSADCTVGHENIDVALQYDSLENSYSALFKITYFIQSDKDQNLPLLFLAINLGDNKSIIVNGKSINAKRLDSASASQYPFISRNYGRDFIRYSKDDSIGIEPEHLIYFSAPLKKGENTIVVEYVANMEYNTYGFERTYKLEYSLYPSKFWKSFGPINLTMTLPQAMNISKSNLGTPQIQDSIYKWKITNINENISLEIKQKTSPLAKVLLFLQPFGIALILTILFAALHIWLLRKKYSRWPFALGLILVPVLFFVTFVFSFNLIDYVLNQEHSKHGYSLLFAIFLFPVVLVVHLVLLLILKKLNVYKRAPKSI